MKLERQYGYVIESYATNMRGSKCSSYTTFKAETMVFVEKYFGNNSKINETLDSFPCEEKVSRYHEFMKSLQLLDALHAAWLMLGEIIGVIIMRLFVRHIDLDICCSFRKIMFILIIWPTHLGHTNV